MSLSVLNNISAVYAENNLNAAQSNLQNTLEQLSSGSSINSGARGDFCALDRRIAARLPGAAQ